MRLFNHQQVAKKIGAVLGQSTQSDFLLSSRLWALRLTWFGTGAVVSTIVFLTLTVLILEVDGWGHKKPLPRCSNKAVIYASNSEPHGTNLFPEQRHLS
jgi:hypothetical protein